MEPDPALLLTLSDDEIARTLRMSAANLAGVAATIQQHPRSTIEPAQRASSDEPGRRAIQALTAAQRAGGIATGLDMGRTIGEGGMGIVRLATQRSLGRQVAVKTLRGPAKDETAALRLLREAWVTGTLEHPNIVPVYDLGLDDDGTPIIILKRIEGVEWAETMRDGPVADARDGVDDRLGSNLRILIQLCNAVSLAHARGVIHRDLKPENVMIGSFGEVYLVDWGIAVSLRPDPLGRLPLASEQSEVAGTPCYMAPEMLGAVGTLSERTDIYLLGAILHEILTGAAPHNGTFKQIVGSILLSTFTYGPDVPRELAEIARRAMARIPEARFESAEELRLRLEWYLRHRGSLAISAEAARRLGAMKELVARQAPADEVHEALYRLFAECRFGFRQALNASEENASARIGLRQSIELIVRFELSRGAAEAASSALAELDAPAPELTAQVAAALQIRLRQKQKMTELELQAAQLDPMTGRRTRAFVAAILGMSWTIGPQLIGAYDRRHPLFPMWNLYVTTVVLAVSGLLVVAWARASLMRTLVNRQIVATAMIVFAFQLLLQMGGALLGMPRAALYTLHLLLWGTGVAGLAVMTDRRIWPSAAAFVAAFLLACMRPARCWDLMSAANFVLLVTFLILWWRPVEDRPRWISAGDRPRGPGTSTTEKPRT